LKTKTASVRLPKEMFEEIDNFCDDIGCTRNDWIKDTLKDKLRTQLDQNTQDQEIEVEDIKPEPVTTEPAIMAHGKILDDYGNVIGNF